MTQTIMQGRQPPPSVPYPSSPSKKRVTKKPPPSLVVVESSEPDEDGSSEDDREEPSEGDGELSTFKRILRRTQKLRSTFRDLKGNVRLKSDNTGDLVDSLDLEKGAGTGDHEGGFSNATTNIEPRNDGLKRSGTLRDEKNTDFDGAMETVPTPPEINEVSSNLENIDEGKRENSTKTRSIEERESVKDRKTDDMGTSLAPKSGPVAEDTQTLPYQQPESQMQEPQVISLLNVPLAMEQSTPVAAGSGDVNSNQHVSDAGEGQQNNERRSRSSKGKETLNDIREEKLGDSTSKAGAATEQESTSRPRKVRIPLGKLNEYLVKGYLSPNNPVNSPLQLRRSLDQYFYTHLTSTSQRDSDQVVYRYTRDNSPEPKIFMVDQLWLWIFNDGTHLLYVVDEALTES